MPSKLLQYIQMPKILISEKRIAALLNLSRTRRGEDAGQGNFDIVRCALILGDMEGSACLEGHTRIIEMQVQTTAPYLPRSARQR